MDIKTWKSFTIADLFSISKPQVYHKRNVVENKTGMPYVVRTKFNNGVLCRVEKSLDIFASPGGVISFGAENASFFYQEEEWCSGRDIYFIDTRHLSKGSCLFIIACLQRVGRKYSYNNGLFPKLLAKEIIKLPTTDEGTPDWRYMEQFMSQIQQKVKYNIF